MTIDYLTNIKETDQARVLLLINASLQAYQAFDEATPQVCQVKKIEAPEGYELVESWSGVDSVFGDDKRIECYGVVFRSRAAPYRYIFAFRGTSSFLGILDDLGAEKSKFEPYEQRVALPDGLLVEAGFHSVYVESDAQVPSMQQQLFALIDRFQASEQPINELLITGHSLGSALCELFTLDIALSRPKLRAINVNYACPRVGNASFVEFYQSQAAQQQAETRTLRVQNTFDKVPLVPLKEMDFAHISPAYLIAFHKEGWLGKLNFIDCHSSENYSAVLQAASDSYHGVCICESLEVPSQDYAVTSFKPNEGKLGSGSESPG